jgi:hypothetical protein
MNFRVEKKQNFSGVAAAEFCVERALRAAGALVGAP